MGLFSKGSWLSNSWNTIKSGVTSIPKTVSRVVQTVPISQTINSVGNTLTSATKTIHSDVVAVANFGAKQIDKLTDYPLKVATIGSNTITGLGKDVVGLGNAISMPLAIGLGVAGIFLVGVLAKK